MSNAVRIGILGDFNPKFRSHPATTEALQHAAHKLDLKLDSEWIPTPSLTAQAARAVANVAAMPTGSGSNRTPLEQPATKPAADHSGNFKDVLLAEIKRTKAVFYNMVVAQAQRIEVAGDRVTFSFTPAQRALKDQFEQQKAWLESMAQPIAGRRITMASVQADASSAPPPADNGASAKGSAQQSAENG